MKHIWTVVLAAVVVTPAAAAAKGPALTLTTSSESPYEVWCKIEPQSGDPVTRYMERGRPAFSSTNVRRATCDYKAGNAPVTIGLAGDEWACPFKAATEGKCEQVLAKASFGQFEVRRKVR